MANKKKLQLGLIQANKFISELLELRDQIAAPVQFRNDLLESLNGFNTKANSIDYKVLND